MTLTANLLSGYFSRERQLHGLYGLYPKYGLYIQPIAGLLLMISHVLCFTTLQHDAGTPSDVREYNLRKLKLFTNCHQ